MRFTRAQLVISTLMNAWITFVGIYGLLTVNINWIFILTAVMGGIGLLAAVYLAVQAIIDRIDR